MPDELTVEMWQQNMHAQTVLSLYKPAQDLLLLDGIPRTVAQAKALEKYLDVLLVLHLICPNEDEMVRRMRRRALKENRIDDADEKVIRKRFEVYANETRPVLDFYPKSIVREVQAMAKDPEFKGHISDVGGPTANMYQMRCSRPDVEAKCRRLSCVHPGICENLVTDHGPLLSLMKRVREEPGVKKVFLASGVRYDLAERSPEFIETLAKHHTGGQLSVAPEHSNKDVLDKMKKPGIESYERFAEQFQCASEESGKNQFLVPYFISGHPGSTLKDMVDLALWLKARNMKPRQVQDFIPTPMSVATTMYFTGIDPLSRTPVYTARDLYEKRLQKALILYWDPAHHDETREALVKVGRQDLIGTKPGCLVPPASGTGSLSIHQQRGAGRARPPTRERRG